MPEIKNTFLGGRLNKDLDERLIGSGEYRDALNINVVSSESDDAGTVENLMGNQIISAGANTIPTGAKVIGSVADGANDKMYYIITSPTYDGIYEFNQTNNSIAILIRGDLNLSEDYPITGINVIDGLLFWTDNLNEPRKVNIETWKDANHVNVPTKIFNRAFSERDITVIKRHPKERLSFEVSTNPDADKLPFEEIFPQFGYRWKYADGEYSPFSFFTEPVFVADEYSALDHYKEGYNEAVRNIVTEITIGNIPRGPEDVISIDILYTESISTTIYTLKTILKEDWGYSNGREHIDDQIFTKRSFYSAIPNNQLSRHFDSIPLKAKAQEITANRLVYANYLHNFKQPKTALISVSQQPIDSNNGLSVKGFRDYEIGVVYEDQHGRQGALITGGAGYTTKFSTNKRQALDAKIIGTPPSWATHFKYYIKDSSQDHHNFVCYNTFNDGDEAKINSEFIWLQIPSSERNKIDEDTFIIPRRHTHSPTGITTGDGSNQLGFVTPLNNVDIRNVNVAWEADTNTKDRICWAPGNGVAGGPDWYDGSGQQDDVNGMSQSNPESIFTCTVPGKYTFEFEGELEWFGENQTTSGYVKTASSFQVARNGQTFNDLRYNFEKDPRFKIATFTGNGAGANLARDYRFYSTMSVDLEAGDKVRPVIGRYKCRRRKRVHVGIKQAEFRTVSTPPDPNQNADPAVEKFNYVVKNFSRHKVLEIESEAPDIVKSQLPVDLRKLGSDVKSTTDVHGNKNRMFLSTGFNVGLNILATSSDYDEQSKEIYYESDHNSQGLSNASFISALNSVLTMEGLPALQVEGVDAGEYDEAQVIDVSGVEGGLWFGAGSGVIAETGIANKTKILEIAVGYAGNTDPGSDFNRDVLRITLEEGVGIDLFSKAFAIHKGDLTENALKNLSGSFFVKVKRKTNNEYSWEDYNFGKAKPLDALPTGQSVFNEDNEVQTLKAIWFETMPSIEDSNLNLFWEGSESIPIAEHNNRKKLDFYNCVAVIDDGVFIETQRIFDQFNSVQMVKGVRVNVPQENYEQERRKNGLIYSGIFNSRTGTNRLNQFVYSDGITKDIEPNYGGIQKLYTRDTNLVALCEDKVFSIMADKDILFNADGNPQVVGSRNVLGQTTPFVGEFGISKEAQSFASYANRMYFVDSSRGSVIRLSTDGITQISEAGMSDFFRDKLKSNENKIVGSYDSYSGQYVLTLDDYSLTFSEKSKGWVSRVSYQPENAISLNNIFYTFNNGNLWQHNIAAVNRNNFYGIQYQSALTTVFNQEPSSIKAFKTLNYEGTKGWEVPLILTDQQSGSIIDFVAKEGKWYNNINGISNENLMTKINSLNSTNGTNGAIDFFKDDKIKRKTYNSIQSKKVYKFVDDDSLYNDHLGIGNLTGVTLADGTTTPSPIAGQGTITFNVT